MSFRCRLWVEDDLHDAFAVSQVDENQTAVVASAVHPARQQHCVTNVLCPDLPAVGRLKQRVSLDLRILNCKGKSGWFYSAVGDADGCRGR